MLAGIVIVLVFLLLAGLMMTRKMPALLALPVMAVAIGVIAGVAAGLPWSLPEGVPGPTLRDFLFTTILTKGSSRLADAMMAGIFGAILSQVVMRQGIAQRIIRVAAEYAGDHKLLLAFVMTAAIAVSFTSLTGLGAVIMVGSLALPILIGAGLEPAYSACLMLFAISIGGVFNGTNWKFYESLMGVDVSIVKGFATSYGLLLALATLAFLVIEGRRQGRRFTWAVETGGTAPAVPAPALITPLVPIFFILAFGWPIIPSFVAAILFGCLATQPARIIPNLTAATLEGLKDVSPVLGLFIGIGMAVNAMTDPLTNQIMSPFIQALVPTTAVGYVAFFTLLAPLTLYRGPLNTFGLGAGFAVLLLTSKMLSPQAILGAFLAVGQIQGVSDPTNTSNVWIAQFTHSSTEVFLKRTLPYVWAFVLVALLYATFVLRVI